MSKKVYVLLAEGFELIEALAPVDVLRRGGVELVTLAISDGLDVMSAQKVSVKADALLKDTDLTDGDLLVLPGGYPGYVNLGDSGLVAKILKEYEEKDKFVAAICGAPTVLTKNSVFKGKKVTCHSSVAKDMEGYTYTANIVETDGKLITGIGAGRALEFGFEIAKALLDEESIKKIKKGMELEK